MLAVERRTPNSTTQVWRESGVRRAGHRKLGGCEQWAQEQNDQEHRSQEQSTSNLSRLGAGRLLACRDIIGATVRGPAGRSCACRAGICTTSCPTPRMRVLPKPSLVSPLRSRLRILNTLVLEQLVACPMQCAPIFVPGNRYEFASEISNIKCFSWIASIR